MSPVGVSMSAQGAAAVVAELLACAIRLAATGARDIASQMRAALAAEAGVVRILVTTAGAIHPVTREQP
jgi:hypothetical protein